VSGVTKRVPPIFRRDIQQIVQDRLASRDPRHAYTRKLLAAVPVADPGRRRRDTALSSDEIPSPIRDVGDEPNVAPLVEVAPGHFVAQHRVGGPY
jgi:glutathione transport system ATP-binding protein